MNSLSSKVDCLLSAHGKAEVFHIARFSMANYRCIEVVTFCPQSIRKTAQKVIFSPESIRIVTKSGETERNIFGTTLWDVLYL